MILKQGSFVEGRHNCNLWLCTTNSIKNNKGELIMGAGSAAAMKYANSAIPRIFGERISSPLYGLVTHRLHSQPEYGPYYVGGFQTKYHWRMDSDLDLIRFSTVRLVEWLTWQPTFIVVMPFPGIQNGNLKREDVLPIISLLPDNVTVYERVLTK